MKRNSSAEAVLRRLLLHILVRITEPGILSSLNGRN